MVADDHGFDPERALEALNRHGVEFIVVGGVGANVHGGSRETHDLDTVPSTTLENLDRLAAAMRELHAHLRVARMSNEEARALPVQLDGETLHRWGNSTWVTDAGPFDVLGTMETTPGRRLSYDDLAPRAIVGKVKGLRVRVAALDDIIASKETAGRAKDHEALPELRRLAAQRNADKGRTSHHEGEQPPHRDRPGIER